MEYTLANKPVAEIWVCTVSREHSYDGYSCAAAVRRNKFRSHCVQENPKTQLMLRNFDSAFGLVPWSKRSLIN